MSGFLTGCFGKTDGKIALSDPYFEGTVLKVYYLLTLCKILKISNYGIL